MISAGTECEPTTCVTPRQTTGAKAAIATRAGATARQVPGAPRAVGRASGATDGAKITGRRVANAAE
eukprot:2827357-Pyramimonas_sp.AAC.1